MIDLPPVDQTVIIVTASRTGETSGESAASVSTIDRERLLNLGEPQVAPYLRLIPSLSVSTSGPTGSLTQVRIRGAEANHTLLFVDGIRANDPAAGNEPRFELMNADIANRIEVVRGPQSALWGSEAIGGVIAVSGEPAGSSTQTGRIEVGSHDTLRASASAGFGDKDRGLTLSAASQRSDGIDSFDGGGDRDGYRNRALRGSGRLRVSDNVLLGASGFGLWGRSEFDGYDPFTYQHADTLDESHNRLTAGRIFAEVGKRDEQYLLGSASLLGSSNRNFVGDNPVNRTSATRRNLSLEGGLHRGRHSLVAALESEREDYRSRDVAYGGFTDQDQDRRHTSLTAEWKMTDLGPLTIGAAIRHDMFNRFRDATSLRASALADLGHGFAIAANYAEGIAQPSFVDLYGFFPGSFVGNPDVKPERSRGGEISLRYSGSRVGAAITYYRQRLTDEIVGTYNSSTFTSSTANATGRSKRQGVELEAAYRPNDYFRFTATWAYLDASEPGVAAGTQLKEQRRPKHSGSIAVDGSAGRFSYGAALSYTGPRIDTNFDVFPSARVELGNYWLAGGQIAYRVAKPVDLTLRVANAFDSNYQDVVGYRTEGRSIHAGLRVALGR